MLKHDGGLGSTTKRAVKFVQRVKDDEMNGQFDKTFITMVTTLSTFFAINLRAALRWTSD
jgi:hypothetical protein